MKFQHLQTRRFSSLLRASGKPNVVSAKLVWMYVCMYVIYVCNVYNNVDLHVQVNKKFRKFEMKYRDCLKRNGDKIGTQTC